MSGNGGDGGFAGALASSSNLTVTNSTFNVNQSGNGGLGVGNGGDGGDGGVGGAIFVSTPGVTLANLTIDSNIAGAAGGGAASGAPGSGGGIFSGSGSGVALRNSIISNNTRLNVGPNKNCAGTIDYGQFNVSFPSLDSGCAEAADLNPGLGPLADNGGPTLTMALGAGSPAIDRIPPTGFDCPATDQRGITRPQGSACDLGAFELVPPPAPEVTAPAPTPAGTAAPTSTAKKCKKGFKLKKVKGKKKRCVKKKRKRR